MSNTFKARGNLGAAPELKSVTVAGETRQVADIRIYCDRSVPDGNGGFSDKGGFWLSASVWDRRGEHAARVLDKGMRVNVEGTLVQNTWSKDGEERSRLELAGADVSLDLSRIESVTLRQRAQPARDDNAYADHGANRETDDVADDS